MRTNIHPNNIASIERFGEWVGKQSILTDVYPEEREKLRE